MEMTRGGGESLAADDEDTGTPQVKLTGKGLIQSPGTPPGPPQA
jgi:hypothetical protein